MTNAVVEIKKNLTLEKVLLSAMRMPGVKIQRSTFLQKELRKYCTAGVIREAICTTPASAGIAKKVIDKISKDVINYETRKATGVSIVASAPSSIVPIATIGAASTDIVSYFAFVLRVVQELAYLYGFHDFELDENSVDSETMDTILVFLGVMFGVKGATVALGKIATTMAGHVAKDLTRHTLSKGTIYPIVKKIAQKIGYRMTKQVFADGVASAIPVAGCLASGGITYIMFKPNCMRLRKSLMVDEIYTMAVPKMVVTE